MAIKDVDDDFIEEDVELNMADQEETQNQLQREESLEEVQMDEQLKLQQKYNSLKGWCYIWMGIIFLILAVAGMRETTMNNTIMECNQEVVDLNKQIMVQQDLPENKPNLLVPNLPDYLKK
mgnify:CR=1 FL=1